MNWYIDVLKKYTVFNGRATRSEYWYFVLINVIISIILVLIGHILKVGDSLSTVYSLAVFLPSTAVAARRLHDIGRTGWWQLIILIPMIGFIVLIIFFAKDGEPIDNQYGQNPKEARF